MQCSAEVRAHSGQETSLGKEHEGKRKGLWDRACLMGKRVVSTGLSSTCQVGQTPDIGRGAGSGFNLAPTLAETHWQSVQWRSAMVA